MQRELHFTLTYGPADQGRYLRLPFDVPRTPTAWRSSTRTTGSSRRSFRKPPAARSGHRRPRPLTTRSGRLRGWSGSERASAAISASSATPATRRARWARALGAFAGALQDQRARRGPRHDPPARETRGPARGDLHVHTVNSDGPSAPPSSSSCAGGMDWTSWPHGPQQHPAERRDRPENGITVIPGMEYTNYRGTRTSFSRRRTGGSKRIPLQQLRGDAGHGRGRAGDGGHGVPQPPAQLPVPLDVRVRGFPWDMVEAWNGTGDPGNALTIRVVARPALPWRAHSRGGRIDFHRHELLRHVGAPSTFVYPPPGPPTTSWPACVPGGPSSPFRGRGPSWSSAWGEGVRRERDARGAEEGTAVVRSARAGDRARLLDGRGNVKEWQAPFDGEHTTRFDASPTRYSTGSR